jgi:CTP:molybdopterin cytidylyltransferase MocA
MDGLMIFIPAAGFGRRMRGTDKLLTPIDGVPLLARVATRACATGAPVLVGLPVAGAPGRAAALAGTGALAVPVQDAAEGMAASLRAGARAALACGARALMVLPGDMPDLDTPDLVALAQVWRGADDGTIVQATTPDGRPGHPVILPANLFPAMAELTGDTGARGLLRARPGQLIRHALPGMRALTDLDTPEAWADWHATRG